MSKRAILLLQKNTWWMLVYRNFHPHKLWWLRVFGIIVLAAHGSRGELFFIEFLQIPPASRSKLYRYLRPKLIEWKTRTPNHSWHTATRMQHVVAIIKNMR